MPPVIAHAQDTVTMPEAAMPSQSEQASPRSRLLPSLSRVVARVAHASDAAQCLDVYRHDAAITA